MIQAYFNYPNSRVVVHTNPDCIYFHEHRRPGKRVITLNSQSIGIEIEKFRQKKYSFCPMPIWNDLWLVVDFGDQDFEESVVRHIHRLLANRYRPFAAVQPRRHC